MTEDATGSAAAAPLTTAITSAEELAAARERRGLGRGEVAQRLKLRARQLDALERGDWDALPGRAFVRGCVRSYGRLLEVDVGPLLESIGGVAEADSLRASATLSAPLPRSGGFAFDDAGRGGRWPWAVLGVVGVIAVALFFGRDGDVGKVTSWIGKTEPPAASPAPGPATSPAADAGGTGSAGAPLVPPPLVPPPGAAGPAAAPMAAAAPAVVAAPVVPAVPPPPPAPPPPPIRLTVKQDAWVDVRQSDGRSVFMGTVKPGAPLELKGQAPFALTIGNANQVALEFEGKAVDLQPLTASPNNIARVKLP